MPSTAALTCPVLVLVEEAAIGSTPPSYGASAGGVRRWRCEGSRRLGRLERGQGITCIARH